MPGLIQDYCTRNADQRPESTAVKLQNTVLTYAELESISNRIGRVLQEAGCMKADRVALFLPKSPIGIAAILGILKAGCIYVPIDPESPASRARSIIASAEPRLVLADSSTAKLLSKVKSADPKSYFHVGWMDKPAPPENIMAEFRLSDLQSVPDALPNVHRDSSGPAYIMYTSGSTGVPKGVVIHHESIAQFIEWAAAYFTIRPTDRLSGHTPLHFDLSTFDIFGSLHSGAELHLVPAELNLRPAEMAEFIRSSRLTQWFSVPAVLNYMAKFNAIAKHDFPHLRRVLWCGEVFPVSGLRCWMTHLPHVSFTNLYGPTEATIASSYHTLTAPPKEGESVPIGRACDGEQLFVLDAGMQPVQPGETGELYITGAGLSAGYWKDPEKTAASFVQRSVAGGPDQRLYRTGDLAKIGHDGLVYFLGRSDSQIKSRGYRIELGEVEAALNAIDGVKESAVIAAPTNGFENAVICCAYSPRRGVRITPTKLRRLLGARIPRYMFPSRWLELERLPRNANGKADKSAIQELFAQNETISSVRIE